MSQGFREMLREEFGWGRGTALAVGGKRWEAEETRTPALTFPLWGMGRLSGRLKPPLPSSWFSLGEPCHLLAALRCPSGQVLANSQHCPFFWGAGRVELGGEVGTGGQVGSW